MKFFKKSVKKGEKGQVLVILALLVIGLIAIIGLAVDTGYMYVSYSRLRRAVDAAALAATGEFKRGFTIAGLQASAQQMLDLNEVVPADDGDPDSNPATNNNIKIEICATNPGDAVLCTTPPRKIVRVTVTEDVPTFFLAVIGFQKIPITISSVSEAATVDVVLLIDSSESMAWTQPDGTNITGPMRDPNTCNNTDLAGADGYPGECHPFEEVKAAATAFIDQLYFPYDRVGIVSYNQYATVNLPMDDDATVVENTIQGLTIFEGLGQCAYYSSDPGYNDPPTWQQPPPPYPAGVPLYQPCRLFNDTIANGGGFQNMDCPMFYGGSPEAAYCGNTNTGDGFLNAGNALAGDYPASVCAPGVCPPVRDDAVWVVIFLSDGAPNSAFDTDGDPICPGYTQTYAYTSDAATLGQPCRDIDSDERHVDSDLDYDADDYARDMIDFVAGNNTFIFSIGLGNIGFTRAPWLGDPPAEAVLEYAAQTGGGDFYEAPTASELNAIFLAIANNIATRINQ